MKKAYLVTFNVCTRVTADVPEGFDPNNVNLLKSEELKTFSDIIDDARKRIVNSPYMYLCDDNIEECEEDLETPYGFYKSEE